jgi:hypothetical protein
LAQANLFRRARDVAKAQQRIEGGHKVEVDTGYIHLTHV